MNARGALCAAVVAIAAVYAGGAQSQVAPPAVSAEQLLAEAIADEKLAESGVLCFRITVEGDALALMLKEAPLIDHVVYAWAPGGKFKIALMGKDGPIRTVVSDGNMIDAGGKTWDARFAFDYAPYPTEESKALVRELAGLMWVYNRVLNKHLHPLTQFQHVRTMERWTGQYRSMSVDHTKTTDTMPHTYTLRLERTPYIDLLEVVHDDITYARSLSGFQRLETYERGALVDVPGVGWVPKSCSFRHAPIAGEPRFRYTSELCADQPAGPPDPSEFGIPSRETAISWPYGTPMKNFWHGIVNTFKGMWDGIADGEIGD
jgi:hypothetical protein